MDSVNLWQHVYLLAIYTPPSHPKIVQCLSSKVVIIFVFYYMHFMKHTEVIPIHVQTTRLTMCSFSQFQLSEINHEY